MTSCARNYDPYSSKFLSEDPIGFKGKDINLYRYVQNNPLMFSDPFGLYTDAERKCLDNASDSANDIYEETGSATECAKTQRLLTAGCGMDVTKNITPENPSYEDLTPAELDEMTDYEIPEEEYIESLLEGRQ